MPYFEQKLVDCTSCECCELLHVCEAEDAKTRVFVESAVHQNGRLVRRLREWLYGTVGTVSRDILMMLFIGGFMCGCYVSVPTVPFYLFSSTDCEKRSQSFPALASTSECRYASDDCIHVFLFAGFRLGEVEQQILDEVSTTDVPMFNALVLRYEITDFQHIVELTELGFIGSINWKVPEVAYGYHVLVDAPPTDAVLEALDEWARETTEGTSGSVVSVLSETEVLLMIQRMSDIPPVVM